MKGSTQESKQERRKERKEKQISKQTRKQTKHARRRKDGIVIVAIRFGDSQLKFQYFNLCSLISHSAFQCSLIAW